MSVAVQSARYVPDPRAGRNAWMVTTLVVVDLGERENFPRAAAGSDLTRVVWFPVQPLTFLEAGIRRGDLGGSVFFSHREMLTDLLGA